ncbi:hypothetical protein ABZ815_51625 [Nonomuraea sp. NPDC047529]|uniref:hypothetical protein n=1 Tax=Nonomuraea sp. NPDC047529 TaxID=3155623 RepID=UPI0033D4153E
MEQDRLTADVRHAALESRLNVLEREAVTNASADIRAPPSASPWPRVRPSPPT